MANETLEMSEKTIMPVHQKSCGCWVNERNAINYPCELHQFKIDSGGSNKFDPNDPDFDKSFESGSGSENNFDDD